MTRRGSGRLGLRHCRGALRGRRTFLRCFLFGFFMVLSWLVVGWLVVCWVWLCGWLVVWLMVVVSRWWVGGFGLGSVGVVYAVSRVWFAVAGRLLVLPQRVRRQCQFWRAQVQRAVRRGGLFGGWTLELRGAGTRKAVGGSWAAREIARW